MDAHPYCRERACPELLTFRSKQHTGALKLPLFKCLALIGPVRNGYSRVPTVDWRSAPPTSGDQAAVSLISFTEFRHFWQQTTLEGAGL